MDGHDSRCRLVFLLPQVGLFAFGGREHWHDRKGEMPSSKDEGLRHCKPTAWESLPTFYSNRSFAVVGPK